jgi:hypothetical protein
VNKKIKAKWVAALRSGEYKKGNFQLRNNDDEFCCLGVLCNLHAQAHPEIAALQQYEDAYMNQQAFLPFSVMIWAELKEVNPFVKNLSLSQFNDESNLNFKQIALLIDKNL